MRISAKTDYAIRAAVEMAAHTSNGQLVKAETVADAQDIPLRFLLSILNELRHAGIVASRRGTEGGYRLARAANKITLADIIRAIDGPLANVAGTRPEALELTGSAEPLRDVLDLAALQHPRRTRTRHPRRHRHRTTPQDDHPTHSRRRRVAAALTTSGPCRSKSVSRPCDAASASTSPNGWVHPAGTLTDFAWPVLGPQSAGAVTHL